MIYARTDKGVLSARLEQAELAALVRRVAAAFERRHTGVTLKLELPEQLEALVDTALLETALENLLENAQKYGPTPQGFELTLSADTKQILLSVRDFGPGVAPAARERIFRAFERGDARLSKATSGTGLGLFLVRAIAHAHGGEVKLVPKQPGCSFELRLPRQNVQPAAGEESAP
jgi:signal transduction histidine kinase